MSILIMVLIFLGMFLLLKSFSVKTPLTITLVVAFVVSIILTVSLWFNYLASFGEQDGIAISNKISYWLITDGTRWSQELFKDYYNYSLFVTILIASLLIISYFTNKTKKVT